MFRLNDKRWEDLGRLGAELEVMGMLVHNGQLYAGALPLAEVYRYKLLTALPKAAPRDSVCLGFVERELGSTRILTNVSIKRIHCWRLPCETAWSLVESL